MHAIPGRSTHTFLADLPTHRGGVTPDAIGETQQDATTWKGCGQRLVTPHPPLTVVAAIGAKSRIIAVPKYFLDRAAAIRDQVRNEFKI